MKLNNLLVVYAKPTNKEQKLTLQAVKKILQNHGIKYKLANREKLNRNQFKGKDLIIAVGGDGTFLRAAQFVKNEILFGVNADVENKEGFFMKANRKNFGSKLIKIMNNKFKIKKMPRLEAFINNKNFKEFALNEFFVGQKKSYHAAKYTIQVGNRKERQKSSGILVTTPSGSHAWAKACCGKTLGLNSKSFQFVVREPYEGKVFKNYKLKHGVLRRSQKVSIISEMLQGILIADSVGKEYSLKSNDKVTIRLSSNDLKAVWF